MHSALQNLVDTLDLGGPTPSLAFRPPKPSWPEGLDDGQLLSLYCTALSRPESNPRFASEVRLSARFLATAWVGGQKAEANTTAANDLLGRLWLALELASPAPDADPLIEHALDPASEELWLALGLQPRPALWLTVTASVPRPRTHAKPVEYRVFEGPPADRDMVGPSVEATGPLTGKVTRGAQRTPVGGAVVTLPAHKRSTRTDALGNFVFLDVPRAPLPTVEAKVGTHKVTALASFIEDRFAPVLIHFDP